MKKYATIKDIKSPSDLKWLPASFNWLGTDSAESFMRQKKEHQEFWNSQPTITYDINQYGFRSDEFTETKTRDSITFIGCSNTVGIGMDKERTWTHLLSKKLGLKEINLGIGGSSTDSAFRVYNEWQYIHRSKVTCFLLPPSARLELVKKNNWRNVGHWSENDDDLKPEFLVELLDPTLNEVRTDRNIAAVKHVAHETLSKIIILPYHSRLKNDFARDNMHAGPKWHKEIAKAFEEKIGLL